jgi:type IV pilus assembly protein PilA
MKTKLKPLLAARQAFSLVELLVVIAVIAIIAAIAIPNIANITGAAEDSALRRNAQNIASVYASAVAAGSFDAGNPADLDALIAALREGVSGGARFPDMQFSVDGIADNDVATIVGSGLLTYDQATGVLIYSSDAAAPADPLDPDEE